MAKKLKKGEKLDLILSELAKLRAEVKKLAIDRAAVADQGVKAKSRSPLRRSRKLLERTGAGKKADSDVTPSPPVLDQAPTVSQPNSRTASR